MKDKDWIPIIPDLPMEEQKLPEPGRYVLLSFENFSPPLVGRCEIDENGASFYVGDDDEPLSEKEVFVNAWQPLPECWRGE